MSTIPEGWVLESVGELASSPSSISYGVLKPGPEIVDGIPMLRVKDLKNGQIDPAEIYRISPELDAEYARTKLIGGEIVLSIQGTVGRVAIVPSNLAGANVSRTLAVIPPIHSEIAKWMWVMLQTPQIQNALRSVVSGTTRDSLNLRDLRPLKLPVAPLKEQRRIVAKLEKLLSRVNAAQARLATFPRLLKRFRQSVLAAACSGKLTADWREQGLPTETSSDLFRRIKAAKEQLIAKRLIKNEPDLLAINEEEYPFDIPQNWLWVRLGEICSHIADIDHKMPKAVEQGVKFLSAKDLLDDGSLNFTEDIKLISTEDYLRLSRKIKPQRDDVIYSRIGARLGKARLVQTDETFLVSYSCCVIRPLIVDPTYVARFLDSAVVLSRAINDAQSIGVPDLGIKKIKEFAVPLPPLTEQQEIVRRVEALFKTADALEARYRTAKAHIDKLTQSILARAFRGELVTTEAELARQEGRDYEPASVLLERIRQERERSESAPKSKRSTKARKKQDRSTKAMFG